MTCLSSEALLLLMLCDRMNEGRVREERPVPDLPVLPQGRRSHTGLGPHCPQGWVLPEEGGSRAKEGRSRGAAIVLTEQFLLPFSLPTPPLPGESLAQQKINPKTVTWTGLRLPGRSSREARMEERWPVATLPKSSRVPDLFLPRPPPTQGPKQLYPLSFFYTVRGSTTCSIGIMSRVNLVQPSLRWVSPALERVPQGISLCLLVWSSQSFLLSDLRLTCFSGSIYLQLLAADIPQLPGLDV